MIAKHPIEDLPFFKSFHGDDLAVIDVSMFWEWLHKKEIDFMTNEDLKDREEAYKEHEQGKSLNLKNVIKQW